MANINLKVSYDYKQAKTELQQEIKKIQDQGINIRVKVNGQESKGYWQGRFKEQVAGMTQVNTELRKMAQYYGQLEKSSKSASTIDFERKFLSNKISTFLKQNVNLSGELQAELKGIQSDIQTADKQKLGQLGKQFKTVRSEAEALGQTTKTVWQDLAHNFGKVLTWGVLAGSTAAMLRSFKEAIEELKNIDTLLTEISKTSDMTATQLKALGDASFDAANKYGATVTGYLEGVREMARAGFGDRSTSMAEVSILAQSAGDMTAELANEYLLATDAAYGLNGNIKELTAILDGQNQVTNRNAISMEQMAEATKIAGSQAGQAGIEANELTAALTTMQAKTQLGGSVVGRTFRALLMNIQGVKGELDDGEIIDAASLSKAEEAAKALGVSFKYVENGVLKLRDPMVVLKELAAAFSALEPNDVRGANLVSALGGKFRATGVTALLRNWDTYEKVLKDYANSTGSALKEAQKTADSWEGRLNRLSNTWTEFIGNFVKSDDIKIGISLLEGAVTVFDKIVTSVGGLNTALLVTVGIIAGTKGGWVLFADVIDKVLIKMGLATGAATSLSMALSVMIPIAAIMGGIALFNHFNTTLEEQQKKVADITAEYESVLSQISELEDKKIKSPLDEPLTDNEQKRLEALQQYAGYLALAQETANKNESKSRIFGIGDFLSNGRAGEFSDMYLTRGATGSNPDLGYGSPGRDIFATAVKKAQNLSDASVGDYQKIFEGIQDEYVGLLEYSEELRAELEKPYVINDEEYKKQLEDEKNRIQNWIDKGAEAYSFFESKGVKTTSDLVETEEDLIKKREEEAQLVEDQTKYYESLKDQTDNLSSSMDSINEALAEQADTGELSIGTILDLIDAGYAAAIMFDAETGAATLDKNALITLAKAAIDAQIAELNLAKADIQSKLIADGNAAYDAARGFFTLAAAINASNNPDAANLASIEAQIGALDKLKGQIGNYGGGSSKGHGGGGSREKDVLEAFKKDQEILEHQIEMSEKRQDMYAEDTAEFKREQQVQYDYYMQLAAKVKAEMLRLQALGYDTSSKEMRELESIYMSVMNSLNDIAKAQWEANKQDRIDAIQKRIDKEEERWEKREKQLDAEIDKQGALIDLEKAHYDLLEQIRSKQRSIDNELKIAKEAYEWLDEDTRAALFNEDDYDLLSGKLQEIADEAESLYEDYLLKINSVTDITTDQYKFITKEFEREYELASKKYEMAKSELAVARARTQLENVQSQRTVAMLINGIWTWVADPEAVKQAVEEVYNAEETALDDLSEYQQTQREQALEAYQDSIEKMKEAESAAHDKTVEALEKQIEAIEEMTYAMDEILAEMLEFIQGLMAANAALDAKARSSSSGGGSSSSTTTPKTPTSPTPYPGNSSNPKPPVVKPHDPHYNEKIQLSDDKAMAGLTQKLKEQALAEQLRKQGLIGGSHFASGGVADYTGYAFMDGSPSESELVTNSTDTRKLYQLIHSSTNLGELFAVKASRAFDNMIERNNINNIRSMQSSSIANDNRVMIGNMTLPQEIGNTIVDALRRVLPIHR